MRLRDLLKSFTGSRGTQPGSLDRLTEQQRRERIRDEYERTGMLRLEHDRRVNANRRRG